MLKCFTSYYKNPTPRLKVWRNHQVQEFFHIISWQFFTVSIFTLYISILCIFSRKTNEFSIVEKNFLWLYLIWSRYEVDNALWWLLSIYRLYGCQILIYNLLLYLIILLRYCFSTANLSLFLFLSGHMECHFLGFTTM